VKLKRPSVIWKDCGFMTPAFSKPQRTRKDSSILRTAKTPKAFRDPELRTCLVGPKNPFLKKTGQSFGLERREKKTAALALKTGKEIGRQP